MFDTFLLLCSIHNNSVFLTHGPFYRWRITSDSVIEFCVFSVVVEYEMKMVGQEPFVHVIILKVELVHRMLPNTLKTCFQILCVSLLY